MSQHATRLDPEELPPPICDYCGGEIEESDQDCNAQSNGVCSP